MPQVLLLLLLFLTLHWFKKLCFGWLLGNLVYFTNDQASRLKAHVPTTIETGLYPFVSRYEGHREILRMYEKRIHRLSVRIKELINDMDEWKSIFMLVNLYWCPWGHAHKGSCHQYCKASSYWWFRDLQGWAGGLRFRGGDKTISQTVNPNAEL